MVQGVIVEECGPVLAGIYSYRTDGLVIQDTIFRNTFGLGMQLEEVNNLLLKNCTFVANVNHRTHDGGDFDESFMRVNDLDTFGLSGGGLYARASTSSLIALIEDCRFVNNKDTFDFNKSKRPPLFRLDGHGGGAFIRITKVANSSVVFRNTIFDSNSAIVDGGAVYVSMSGPVSNNSIRFEHCLFYNNSVTDTSGGAISVVMYNGTKESEVVVQNCVFEENSATGGGAIGFIVYDIGDLPDDILVSIESSSFKHNQARTEGSAIGAYSLSHVDVVPFQIQIQNCTFEVNDANDTSINEEDVARGAVSLFRFPITFKGKNRFYRNIGGGVSTVESQITVAENSHLVFEDNSANYGGGLQLVGASLFVVNRGSVVDFVNNTAHVLGGGIMVDSPDFISNFLNRFCFIRYSDPDVPPQSWENVSINFINNSATVGGAALYGSNLKRCSWLNLTASSSKDYTIFTPPEGLSVPFVFSGNYLNSNETEQIVKNMSLGTNPVKVNITILIENNDYRLQPGETFSVNIFNQDNFGNSRRGIMCVEFHALNVTFRDAEKCTNYAVGDDHETVSFRVPGIVQENAVKNTPANITFRLPMYSVCHTVCVFHVC
jgi:predicted outer membrane repeat protein